MALVPSNHAELETPYLTSVCFKDLHDFQTHLQEKGKSIKTKAESLLTQLAAQRENISPKTSELESQIANLLAAQKEYFLRLDRLNAEKEQMSEQLNAATLRYFKAEKKLDRAKSAQVQRLEQQAFANATRPVTTPTEGGPEPSEVNGSANELLVKYEEATAAATKQKEQLDTLLAELKTVQEENTSLKSRRETLTDEDYIRTDVFKQFKSQNEDLIKRINTLEATNKQLREEAEKLQAERTAFRTQLEADINQVAQDYEADIAARDQDLNRVRSARDEILAENVQRRANAEQERIAMEHIKELVTAKEDRISALELELARLKPTGDEETGDGGVVEDISEEELRQRYKKLKQDFYSINQELPAMEKAYKKMKDLAQKKVLDYTALEEKIAILIAEKSKADQKYFSARKDADTRNSEIRSLRHQSGKSAELIAQLKDFESQTRTLLSNLEKQSADLKQANAALAAESKKIESSSLEAVRRSESVTKQVGDLTNLVKSKDASSAVIRERNAMQEVEVEKLKVRIEHVQKDRDSWKNKALSNSSEEEDMLRVSFALISLPFLLSFSLSLFSSPNSLVLTRGGKNRPWPCVRYAAPISRTRHSRLAVISSATNAWMTALAIVCGNVLAVQGRLTRWMSCRFTFEMNPSESSCIIQELCVHLFCNDLFAFEFTEERLEDYGHHHEIYSLCYWRKRLYASGRGPQSKVVSFTNSLFFLFLSFFSGKV